MADQRDIYNQHACEYDELVRSEDREGALLASLGARVFGKRVIEVGAGTGRLTRVMLEGGAREIFATERARAMLDIARAQVKDERVRFSVADAHALPVDDARYDVGIEGWVFGHFRYWMPEGWREEIGAAIDELSRAVVPGGEIIVIETLGTGFREPSPSPSLSEVYLWLEQDRGFTRHELRTDYEFASEAEAKRVLEFFFGEERFSSMEREILDNGRCVVFECTGLWSKTRSRQSSP